MPSIQVAVKINLRAFAALGMTIYDSKQAGLLVRFA